jgi:hypothetical protein
MRGSIALGLWALCGVGWLACSEPAPPDGQQAQTRAIMEKIFSDMQELLPLSVDVEKLQDPARRAEVNEALDNLSRNAEHLERHTRGQEAQIRFLARSIAEDARDVQRAYAQGRFDRSAFLLRKITENCVVCHTRLPSPGDSSVSQGFVDQTVFDELPLEPRATLQTATRRFDEALATLEALLASPKQPALLLGPLTDYLVISIRVKGDYERPVETLRRFAARPDLWPQLRADVETWVAELPGLRARASGPASLTRARSLIDAGREEFGFPGGRAWLAHFVVASAVLHGFIASNPEPGPELAEAYYLLGITEARIGRNYWVTPAPFLLETAIRLAPQEPFARIAFELLEEELLMSYEGSDFEELPPSERADLDELQALIRAAGPPESY